MECMYLILLGLQIDAWGILFLTKQNLEIFLEREKFMDTLLSFPKEAALH